MNLSYLDTHIAVWLHDGLVKKLTKAAKQEIERTELRISPMVYLEFDYLFRRGRVRLDASALYANLNATFGVTMCSFPFPAVIAMAVDTTWTQDPFDRIIVAQAKANQESPLISADETIRTHYSRAVW